MNTVRFLQMYVAIVLISYTAGSLSVPPGMYSDSGWGFAVRSSMKRGASFNCIVEPDPQDISQDAGGFMATWTPGQYLVPGFLADCGLSLGQALTISAALFSTLGIIGWCKVYQTLGFSDRMAWLSCAIIASTRFFALPFGIYNGGEVLLFGASPFILLLALRLPCLGWRQGVLIVFVFLAGFFLKNSALILALAVCTAISLSNWLIFRGNLRFQLIGCLKWGMVFFITYVLAYILYNSRGWTPVAFQPRITVHACEKGLFAAAAPLMSLVSLDDVISFLLSNPNRPLFPNWQTSLVVMLPLALIAFTVYYCVSRRYAGTRYGAVCLAFLAVYVLVFAVLNVLGSAVSSATEARHFRYAGLVLLPGLLSVMLSHGFRAVRWGSFAPVFALCLYGLSSYLNKYLYLKERDTVGVQGFTQLIIDRDALRWLIRADSGLPPSNSVFYLTSPELGLELHKGRAILTHADFENKEILAKRTYSGSVDNLFVLLPERLATDGKADIILSSFTNYKTWKCLRVGGYVVYYPSTQEFVPQ